MNKQQQDFLQATAWLRPYTRRAAAFSYRTSGYLPAVVRNVPLQFVRMILAFYQKRQQTGCKTG